MKTLNGRTVGIDLGTTNSVVAHVNEQGQPEIIYNREGERTTPSVFAVNSAGQYLVGKLAVTQEGTNAKGTKRSIKRSMGDSSRHEISGKSFSAEEISAEILKKLKSDAEAFFGEPVKNAVITVPAYFDAHKRQCTKVAGELAGLNVIRIINEPTAAAIAYGLDQNKNETVLVFDLGGGTFDVTVMEITDDGVFEVLSTNGDDHLGGDDFDIAVMQLFDRFTQNLEGKELTHEQRARLRDAAEKAKFMLSATDNADISIPYFDIIDGQPCNIIGSVSKIDFEQAIEPMIEKIKKCVFNALEDAELEAEDIDEIVFVGGSTRVPIIAEKIKEWTGKTPNRSINPDEAVALGAAIQAAILSGERTRDMLLLDVNPISLGVEIDGGIMHVMIKRNQTIPAEESLEFTTTEDDQKKVTIKVYQGERPLARDNRKLDTFEIPVSPAPRGVPKIEISFTIDVNGILSVRAKDILTQLEKEVVITGSSSLSQDEIAQILADASAHREQDEHDREVNDLKTLLKSVLISVETLLRESRSALTADIVTDLMDLLASINDAMTMQDTGVLQSLSESALETVQAAQQLVYEKADEYINPKESA